MYKKIIIICGMPRSGTSWLGQIFDSSPDVAFRMEPLFAYRFKNCVNEKSSKEEITRFFREVYKTDDDFIHQKENRLKGSYCSFEKTPMPEILVIKTTRHHNMLPRYLSLVENLDIVSIVRHPCAVINSWINTDREFVDKGCTVDQDWRNGKCRKVDDGEFWGFSDWLAVTKDHVELSHKYKNFHIVRYADLAQAPLEVISDLFSVLAIPLVGQTQNFLKDCNSRHDNDPYSVFKNADRVDSWRGNLGELIAEDIIRETEAFGLGEFIK